MKTNQLNYRLNLPLSLKFVKNVSKLIYLMVYPHEYMFTFENDRKFIIIFIEITFFLRQNIYFVKNYVDYGNLIYVLIGHYY